MTQLDPITDLDSCGGLVGLSTLPVLVANHRHDNLVYSGVSLASSWNHCTPLLLVIVRPCRHRFPVHGFTPTIRHASALEVPRAINRANCSRLAVCGASPGTP